MYWFILFIIFIGILFFTIKTYINANDDYWSKLGVPMVKGNEQGSFWSRIKFQVPIHELDNKIYKKLKSLGKNIKFGGTMQFRSPVLYIIDLDLLKNVMVKDFDYFTNRREFGSKDDPSLTQKMLFAMDDSEWKDLRATLSPTFSTGKIRRMFDIFTESANKMTAFLNDEIQKSSDIEIRDVCGRYTMDVTASTAFGVESYNFKDPNSTFVKMGNRIQAHFSGWIGMLKLLLIMVAPSLIKYFGISFFDMTASNFFKDVALKTIRYRDETGEKRNDFLQLLMEARSEEILKNNEDNLETFAKDEQLLPVHHQKEVKILLTNELIVAQCILFFIGGFDPIEALLIFTAYELALNPNIQNKLSEEIKDAVEKNGDLNYDVVNQLEYLDMVISETLRKYPPQPRTERKCTRDYKVLDTQFEIKKDQIVTIPIWSLHHDADLYPEPDKFIPERFNKENKSKRNPYSYIPFGIGPRNCIAMRFAIIEGKTAIAHLVHNFVIKPTTKTTIPMKYLVTASLKPIDSMWLNIIPRK